MVVTRWQLSAKLYDRIAISNHNFDVWDIENMIKLMETKPTLVWLNLF